ncbi:unnamed protein product [Caenorhabditis bovis]|uniref:Protein phosphatase 1 regulatory subunit 37 homolog n=1 Tax=Caenorhabditis bovis TaxID=2654633 RepID=A0A8S1EE09_9PELO|nr:unnamed protein product [Caenorhabditis bovis]
MSMKFFTGLQDFLGLYESGSATSSPASPIPPTSPSMYSTQSTHSAANSVRKKVSDANKETTGDKIRHCSHDRIVQFPDDEKLITGFHEPQVSSFHSGILDDVVNPAQIVEAYHEACKKRDCLPSANVEKQIKCFHKSPETRQEAISLKGERVSHAQMEALEEIFKRVQFTTIDFEYTFLEDDAAISLAEIIEYYDSCIRLNLSFNKQIDARGWSAIFRAVKNSSSLQMLNLRYTTLDEKSLPALCKTLRATPCAALRYLHLENTQMFGKNLLVLICALKNNTGIKELYLGDNSLQGTDGAHIFQLILNNTSIQLLDLRNNSLGDSGVRHISDALRHRETLEKSSLSALVLWNNHITGASMDCLAEALKVNTKIETLNIGKNKLDVDGVARLKPAIVSSSHLHRLGLQNTNIDCQGAIILAECMADNTALLRVDIRDNPIALAGLLALHSAMKLNKSITLLNIDANCVKLSSEKVREYQEEFERYFNEIQEYCNRNKEEAKKRLTVTFDVEELAVVISKASNVEQEEPNPDIPAEDEKEHDESEKSQENNNNSERVVLPRKDLTRKEKQHQRFTRSSSLTCTETVHDIHDRIREMSGSTHSLDSNINPSSAPIDSSSNLDSMKTIKKSFVVSPSPAKLPISEWGSLPALPQSSPTSTPVVRKLRRFSVSPSSSNFDVSSSPSTGVSSLTKQMIPENPLSRPTSLAIGIPPRGSVSVGPSSAPVLKIESSEIWSPTKAQPKLVEQTDQSVCETDEDKEKICKSVVNDLLNYVEYEEKTVVERKASILMKNMFARPNIDELLNGSATSVTKTNIVRTPLTPSRVLVISEEIEETDENVIQQVVRSLVRDVLQMEKDQIRSTLDRRRRHQSSSVRNSPV